MNRDARSPDEGKLPWRERLDQAARGMTVDDARAAALVRDIRDLSLSAYLTDDPALLFQLRALYSPPPRTFGEAAAVIGALCEEAQDLDLAMELMQRFAAPLCRAPARR